MTEASPPVPSIGANVRRFALAYCALLIAIVIVATVIEMTGFHLSDVAAVGVNIAAYAVAAWYAAGRFAAVARSNWTREDRARLAFGYVVAAYIVSLLMIASLAVLLAVLSPRLAARAQTGAGASIGTFAVVTAIALLIAGAFYYGVARLILARFAKMQPAKAP